MKRLFAMLLCLTLLAGCGSAPAAGEGITFTDDTGTAVTVAPKPEKVAVLLSSLADLWITAGGRVAITVGETVERGFADDTAILVDAGAGKTIDLEALVAQKPDLVIYSSQIAGQAACAEALRAAGIPAAGFQVETFEDYIRVLKIATEILQTPERFETYGTQVRQRVEQIFADAGSREENPSVLFVRAGSSARFTKAKNAENHFVCRMLQELGAVNIADRAPVLLDGLSIEHILTQDPDMILFTTMGDESQGSAYMESLLKDPVWQELTAVQAGRVYQLPKELFQFKPNARWDAAYAYLLELLYGGTP